MERGQQVRVREGAHAGEDGTIMDFEECSRKIAAEWQPCVLWYVQFPSRGTVGVYEEEALEMLVQQPERASSVTA